MNKANDPIVIEHLSKNYAGQPALVDLNLTVAYGDCVGYLGPNGAGKTTTLKILTNLIRATNGRACLNGIDVVRDPRGALKGVGAVVETLHFYPQLTPRECLAYIGEMRGMSRDSITERSHVVLERANLIADIDKPTGQFSKGMKQRLAIAQALLHDPSILIFDEPTSGLDPRGRVEVRGIIKELKQTDVTILMSPHLLHEVQEVCDKVAIIDHGTLLAYDSMSNLSKEREMTVTLTALKPITPADLEAIGSLNGIFSMKQIGAKVLAISVNSHPETQSTLLRAILQKGIDVVSYSPHDVIEDFYLQLIPEGEH